MYGRCIYVYILMSEMENREVRSTLISSSLSITSHLLSLIREIYWGLLGEYCRLWSGLTSKDQQQNYRSTKHKTQTLFQNEITLVHYELLADGFYTPLVLRRYLLTFIPGKYFPTKSSSFSLSLSLSVSLYPTKSIPSFFPWIKTDCLYF